MSVVIKLMLVSVAEDFADISAESLEVKWLF